METGFESDGTQYHRRFKVTFHKYLLLRFCLDGACCCFPKLLDGHFTNLGLSIMPETFPVVFMICFFTDFSSELEASTQTVLNYFLVFSVIFFREVIKLLILGIARAQIQQLLPFLFFFFLVIFQCFPSI